MSARAAFSTALPSSGTSYIDNHVGCADQLLRQAVEGQYVGVDLWGSPNVRANVERGLPFADQAFDTVNQVKDLIAGRMPPGAANPEAARRLSRLKRACRALPWRCPHHVRFAPQRTLVDGTGTPSRGLPPTYT